MYDANNDNDDFIFVTEGGKEIKLFLAKIKYCESRKKDTIINAENPKDAKKDFVYLKKKPIGHFKKLLLPKRYIHPHNRFLVNTTYIIGIDKTNKYEITIVGGKKIMPSDRKRGVVIDFHKSK